MKKVKVIYIRSCKNGMNPGDSAMLDEADAKKVVTNGDAEYEVKPKSKSKEARK